ncbi:PKD-like domain-containing protein [Flavobacterium sp. GT2P42]
MKKNYSRFNVNSFFVLKNSKTYLFVFLIVFLFSVDSFAQSISSFSPTSACTGSGTSVIITGTGFSLATSVTFNGITATSFTIDNNSQITAILSATATTGFISVVTPLGTASSSGIFTVDSLPTATAGGTQTICSNATATVSGASATNGTIVWTENGAGNITAGATMLTPTYTPTAADAGTSVTLTMTVTSTNACAPQTQTATYTIIVNPLPTATAGGTQTICSNATATVSGASATNGTISWTENGAGTITAGTTMLTPTYTPTAADAGTSVTLTMNVTSNNACAPQTQTATYTVIVNPLPTATAGGTQTICSNATATVSGASATNGTISWTENGVGNITAGATTLTPTYTPTVADAGTSVTLTMTVTSNNACAPQTQTATYTIIVNPLPTATAGGTQTICSNATATVSGASATNGTISWTENGAGNITAGATTLTPTYTPTAADAGTSVTLTMTVTSNNACAPQTQTATYAIIVNPLPIATAGGTQTICSNATATVSGASATNGTISWTENGAGNITAGATTLTPTYTPTAADAGTSVTLTMTITSTNACAPQTQTVTYTIIVNPLPTATAGGTQTICSNATATVSGASATNGTISWTENGAGNITAGATTLTPTYTPTAADAGTSVSLTMTVTSTNACAPQTQTATYAIIVNPLPTATAGGTQTICSNATATVSGASATNGTISWTENGAGNITAGATTLTPTYTPTAADAGTSVTLTMTVTSTNACAPQTQTATYAIIVNPLPTSTAGGSQTICSNATATVSGTNSTNGTISWTENGAGSITAGATTLTPTYAPTAADAGTTVTLTMTVTSNNACTPQTATATYTIIVNPLPTLTLTSIPATTSQTLCINTASTDIKYDVGGTGTGASVSGLPAGVIGVYKASQNSFIISGTPTVAGTFNYTVTTSGGCPAATMGGTITVNPTPTVTIPSNITVCKGVTVPVTSFASTPAGGTFTWTNSNTAIGLAASGTGNIAAFLATNAGAAPISATITVIPTVNGCPGTANTYTITVNPTPTVTVLSNITVCNGATIPVTSFASTPAGGTFTWTNSNTAIGLAASGTGNIAAFLATNAGAAPISATITVIPTVNGCQGTANTYTITVNPTPTVTVPSNITVCNGATIPVTSFASTPAGGTFTWTNSNTAIGLAASGTGNIAAFLAKNAGTTPISAIINVIPTVNGCPGTANTYTITVNPTPTVTVPSNITVCNGATIPATSFASTPAGGTFTWTNSNTAIGLAASGTGNIAAFLATNAGATPISATITVIPTVNGCPGTANTYTITVNPTPTVTVPSNITVCNGTTIPATSFASTPAGGTFTWTNSNTAIGLAASGTGNIAAFLAKNAGTTPISATITVIPTVNGCPGTANTYTITVNPTPTVTVPSSITVCKGVTVPVTSFASTPAGGTFTWTNSNTAIGLAAIGTGNIAAFLATNSGATPISATITVIPTVNGCPGTANTYTITVNPTPTVTVPSNITVCNGATIPVTSFASTPAGGTFTWTNSNTAIGLAASGTGNIAAFLATNAGAAPISATITVIPTVNGCPGTANTYTITANPTPTVTVPSNITVCKGVTVPVTSFASTPAGGTFTWTNSNTAIGLAASGTGNIAAFLATNAGATPISATITVIPTVNGCPGTANIYTITVNPTPTVTVPSNITVCNGATIPATSFASTPAGGTFTWTNSNTAIGLAASGTGNIAAFLAMNAGAAPISATITVIPTVNGCPGTANTYTITVNPTPTVTVPSNITVCKGVTVPVTSFTSTPAGGTFTWTNSNTAIGLAASGTGNIAAFLATNAGATPISATITVIPIVNGCPGTANTYTITVNPTPTVTVPSSITVCKGVTVPVTSFTSTPAGGTFTWTNSNTAIGLAASGTGNIAAFLATNAGAAPISATITVIPTVNGCPGTANTYIITVNPPPTVTVPSNITVCKGVTVPVTSFTSTPAGGTFTWTNSNTAIGLAASGTGNIAAFLATNAGATPISATITVIPTVNGCPGTAHTYTITVTPTPVASATPASQSICSGSSITPMTLSSSIASTTFN